MTSSRTLLDARPNTRFEATAQRLGRFTPVLGSLAALAGASTATLGGPISIGGLT